MNQPWETDPDAWKGPDAQPAAWRADELWSVEPWKLEWWQLEAEGYGHSEADGWGTDP